VNVVSVGTDIVNVDRIAKIYEESKEKFLERILTPNEISSMPERDIAQVAYLSKRWAAKEAVAKAFQTGIGQSLSFLDIEIGHLESGAPCVILSTRAKALANSMGISEFKISISDEKLFAVAFVIGCR